MWIIHGVTNSGRTLLKRNLQKKASGDMFSGNSRKGSRNHRFLNPSPLSRLVKRTDLNYAGAQGTHCTHFLPEEATANEKITGQISSEGSTSREEKAT